MTREDTPPWSPLKPGSPLDGDLADRAKSNAVAGKNGSSGASLPADPYITTDDVTQSVRVREVQTAVTGSY